MRNKNIMNGHKQKLIWNNRYTKEGEIWGKDPSYAARLAVLEHYINKGDLIAEIGGGYGRNSYFFREIGANPVIFDISNIALKIAQEHYGLENFKDLDLTKNIPEIHINKYDIIFCNFVIHLLDNSDRISIIENANAMLKTGGVSIWTILSSKDNEFSGINDLFFKRSKNTFHFFSKEEIKELFSNWKIELIRACKEIELIIKSVKETDFWFVVARKVKK